MCKPQLIAITVYLLLEILPTCSAEAVKSRGEIIGTQIPFSFIYGGKSSEELIKNWKKTEQASANSSLRTTSYTDAQTGLQVILETTFFPEQDAVEWLVRMRNGGKADTPLIENLRTMDLRVPISTTEAATLHYVLGSAFRPARPSSDPQEGLAGDYMPIDKPLAPGAAVSFSHYIFQNGQHKDSYLPFFNLQWPGGGVIGAVGWTGQWIVESSRSKEAITLRAGMETTHLKLHPGESIRTPRLLLVEWHGSDWIAGQNELRRVLIAHYLPRVGGKIPFPPVAHTNAYALIFDDIAKKTGKNPLQVLPTLRQVDLGSKGGRGFADPGAALNYVTEKNQLDVIRDMPSVGIEAYWLDAGWFVGSWPGGRGSWVPNKNFPDGLRPLSDAAHERHMKFLLWFDPEGVAAGSMIAKDHPEWVLHQPNEGPWGGIFRFGSPEATKWMIDLLSDRIRKWGIDIYRNDRNINPLPFWQQADSPDRQGITEIRQIEGFYALWDGLLKRFPNLEIDNANWRVTGPDLEVMKRSIGSLTRSELTNGGIPDSTADQAQTAELNLWIPFDANILNAMNAYDFRSTATTGVAVGLDLTSPYIPLEQLRKAVAEVKELRPFWLGDYYPLTAINRDSTAWCGWQFDRPDMDAGFAMFFRRPKSTVASIAAGLRGLDAKAAYEISFDRDYSMGEKRKLAGTALTQLQVSVPAGQSVLIRYRKVSQGVVRLHANNDSRSGVMYASLF